MTSFCGCTGRKVLSGPALGGLALLTVLTLTACTTVPIDPNDGSPPEVTIKVNGPNGYQEHTSVTHGNSTAQPVIEILCNVEDPQGVESFDLRVSDGTVDAAYCGGAVYNGNFQVGGLPAPVSDTLSGSSGKVPTQLSGIIEIPGIVSLSTNPPGVTGDCYPANNTQITVRCRGTNWSSNAGASTTTEYLQVNFQF